MLIISESYYFGSILGPLHPRMNRGRRLRDRCDEVWMRVYADQCGHMSLANPKLNPKP